MKILHVADLHYSLKQFDWLLKVAERFDVIVLAGDMLDLGSAVNKPTQILVVLKYLKRLQPHCQVLLSSGNHDGDKHNEANESVATWLAKARTSGVYVDGENYIREDTLFTICPWWDGPFSREKMNEQIAADAGKAEACRRWIWVHHAPPQDSPTCWTRKAFVGDTNLSKLIAKYQPDFVLGGHIHQAPFYPDGSWIDQIGKTWVINPGKQVGDFPCHACLNLSKSEVVWRTPYDEEIVDLSRPLAEQLHTENV